METAIIEINKLKHGEKRPAYGMGLLARERYMCPVCKLKFRHKMACISHLKQHDIPKSKRRIITK
jgi:hypothetical protein